jgi:uncharacterized membrane protein YbhN (UPF0104 family)
LTILVLLATALLVYGLLGLAVGWAAVSQELAAVGAPLWLLALLVVTAGYGLLFVRWQLLLRSLGHPLAARASGAIFLAGLGLIAAPACGCSGGTRFRCASAWPPPPPSGCSI